MPAKIRPLADYVHVRRGAADDKSAAGIIIPADAQDKSDRGVVLAVGPGRVTDKGHLVEPRVKVGDTVIIQKYGESAAIGVLGSDDEILVRESSILAVIE